MKCSSYSCWNPERIRDVMPAFQGDGGRKKDPAWRRLWTALREIDRYLSNQSA